jgi:ureidoglycolate lyase
MKVGTWHEFPFALVDRSNVIVILRRETTQNLMPDNVVDGEAHGPDLDKKNLVARTGVTVQVKL